MEKLNHLSTESIQQAKEKILEDILQYMEEKEEIPSPGNYLQNREDVIQHIWTNVWINVTTNRLSKKEKREFVNQWYDTEGLGRRGVNRLFRQEIVRAAPPFDPANWVKSLCRDEWERYYEKARKRFFEKEEKRKRERKQHEARKAIARYAEVFMDSYEDALYVYIRHRAGKQLAADLESQPKYELRESRRSEELVEAGNFNPEDYATVEDFFAEWTGDYYFERVRGRMYYDWETYGDRYEELLYQYVFDYVSEYILKKSEVIPETYESVTGEQLGKRSLAEMTESLLFSLGGRFFTILAEESFKDVLEAASLPFDEQEQIQLWEKQKARWEEERRRRIEEERRKREEERRMINDVFNLQFDAPVKEGTRYVLHIGETNTGKTYRALERMKQAESGLYLAPLRLLALEVYETLNEAGIPCSLKTGEEEKQTPGAQHLSATVEMFYEKEVYDVIVIDEAQMIADPDRGYSWYKAITRANAEEVHIIGSKNVKEMLLNLLQGADIELLEYERDIPLKVQKKEFSLNQVQPGDAVICFSRRKVIETASILQKNGYRVSMIYGSMPPETRKMQIHAFTTGKTEVIVSTDAIGMGLNLPIRRIAFLEVEKFDGIRRRRLTSQEVKQIAGRAGRKGIYNVGKVAFARDVKQMKKLLEMEDKPVETFTIAPTSQVLERFQKYSRDLSLFFRLWEKFDNPEGTVKASLQQEQELYEMVKGTEIEARLPLPELYGYLHLPFSTKDPGMKSQWLRSMRAIVRGEELPEPSVKLGSLDEIELSYKSIGLHLLFLYKLNRQTEAIYWERIRKQLSLDANDQIRKELKKYRKECRRCGRKLPPDHPYGLCDRCYAARYVY